MLRMLLSSTASIVPTSMVARIAQRSDRCTVAPSFGAARLLIDENSPDPTPSLPDGPWRYRIRETNLRRKPIGLRPENSSLRGPVIRRDGSDLKEILKFV